MKKDSEMSEMFVVVYIVLVIMLFCAAGIGGIMVADKALDSDSSEPQAWNDVTFAYISTADTAGDYFFYDIDTGIVYKGGQTAFKPAYSDDGYLLVWHDGKIEVQNDD